MFYVCLFSLRGRRRFWKTFSKVQRTDDMDSSVSRWIIWIFFLCLVVHSTGIYFFSPTFRTCFLAYVLSYQESKFSAKTGKQNNDFFSYCMLNYQSDKKISSPCFKWTKLNNYIVIQSAGKKITSFVLVYNSGFQHLKWHSVVGISPQAFE